MKQFIKKHFYKVIAILIALCIIFITIGSIYPYSFAGIDKNIEYNPNNKVLDEYKNDITYFKNQLNSQDLNSSKKGTIEKTLNLFSNPIFMKKDTSKVSKTDLEKFNNEINSLVIELRNSIKENGKTLSIDEFNSIETLKSRFEEYHEWLSSYLNSPFVSEKKWNEILNKFHESLLIDLKELKIFYKDK
ncbi:hypothetical protein ACQKM9_21185 [Viridibacillus sp. NPDC093762]|uniref:hypothetical protein n=1 Tax=Viridibacillus sp. NPDC093762 TaxID=3390720 RepID=UPI003D00DE0A